MVKSIDIDAVEESMAGKYLELPDEVILDKHRRIKALTSKYKSLLRLQHQELAVMLERWKKYNCPFKPGNIICCPLPEFFGRAIRLTAVEGMITDKGELCWVAKGKVLSCSNTLSKVRSTITEVIIASSDPIELMIMMTSLLHNVDRTYITRNELFNCVSEKNPVEYAQLMKVLKDIEDHKFHTVK